MSAFPVTISQGRLTKCDFVFGGDYMPKALAKFIQCVDTVNTWLGKITRLGIFVLIGILLWETISRYLFKRPIAWSTELSAMVFGFYFLIGGGYTLLKNNHVRMDIIYSRWSPRTRAVVDICTFPLLAVYLIVFIKGGINIVRYALETNQRSMSAWGPPLAPIEIITTIGAFLLFLQGVVMFIRDLHTAIKGGE